MVSDTARNGFRYCKKWFQILQEMVSDTARNGFRYCKKWLMILPQSTSRYPFGKKYPSERGKVLFFFVAGLFAENGDKYRK
jgi:hypothetical protein